MKNIAVVLVTCLLWACSSYSSLEELVAEAEQTGDWSKVEERERILVTPNGVDLERYTFEDPAAARAAALEELGLCRGPVADPLVLGFVGYYRPWHRLDVCLRALEHPELEHAVLALIGYGPAREELERAPRVKRVTLDVRRDGPRGRRDGRRRPARGFGAPSSPASGRGFGGFGPSP